MDFNWRCIRLCREIENVKEVEKAIYNKCTWGTLFQIYNLTSSNKSWFEPFAPLAEIPNYLKFYINNVYDK